MSERVGSDCKVSGCWAARAELFSYAQLAGLQPLDGSSEALIGPLLQASDCTSAPFLELFEGALDDRELQGVCVPSVFLCQHLLRFDVFHP